MRGFLFAVFLVICANHCFGAILADTAAPTLTVVIDFEHSHAETSASAMEHELQTILSSAGIRLNLREPKNLDRVSQLGELVYFRMKGFCTMDAPPNRSTSLRGERPTLARTYSSDGEILEMGEVECDRVRASLRRVLGLGNSNEHQTQYGIALARVMVHEVYHMLTSSHAHGRDALTKESLSPRDLLAGKVALSDSIAFAMREHLNAASPSEKPGF